MKVRINTERIWINIYVFPLILWEINKIISHIWFIFVPLVIQNSSCRIPILMKFRIVKEDQQKFSFLSILMVSNREGIYFISFFSFEREKVIVQDILYENFVLLWEWGQWSLQKVMVFMMPLRDTQKHHEVSYDEKSIVPPYLRLTCLNVFQSHSICLYTFQWKHKYFFLSAQKLISCLVGFICLLRIFVWLTVIQIYTHKPKK